MKKDEVILQVDPATGYAYVPTDIQGPKSVFQANLLLDTRASQTVLSAKLAEPLGYHLRSLPTVIVPVAGGQAQSRSVRIGQIGVSTSAVASVDCRFMELGVFDGLLGNDLLRRLNILVVLDVRGRSAKLVFRS